MAQLDDRFDLVVIGGGPAGYVAALTAAAGGLAVALVEGDRVGGTCLHSGCIPAKALLEAAAVRRAVASASEFGVGGALQPEVDFGRVQARRKSVVDSLFTGLGKLLKHRKITVVYGRGSLMPDGSVSVDSTGDGVADTSLDCENVVLAPGSRPRMISGFEPDGLTVVDSDGLLALTELPRTVAVIGGGVIGCEFASMLGDLGVEVTILEAMPTILPGCDDDITRTLIRSFAGRNITVRTGVEVCGRTPHGGDRPGTRVEVVDGDPLDVDLIVVAVGRQPATDTMGLSEAGVEVDDRGFISVDGRYETARSGVFAIGDAIDTPALAHVAFAEGSFVARTISGERPQRIDDDLVPWCIYTHPEVAFTGLSERAARAAGRDVVVSKHRYGANSRAVIIGEPDGMVKVIAEKRADGSAGEILGVQMVGPWVTEQLGPGYLATNLGLEVDSIARFIQPHPTLSELYGEALLALSGHALHG